MDAVNFPPRRLGRSFAGSRPKTNAFRRRTYRLDRDQGVDLVDGDDSNGIEQKVDDDSTDYGEPAAKRIKVDSDGGIAAVETYDGAPLKNFSIFLPPKLPASILNSSSALQEFVHLTTTNYLQLLKLDASMKRIDARIPTVYEEKLSSNARFLNTFFTDIISKISHVQRVGRFFAPKIVIAHSKCDLANILEVLCKEGRKIDHLYLSLNVRANLGEIELKNFVKFLRDTEIPKLTILSPDPGAKELCKEVVDHLHSIGWYSMKVYSKESLVDEPGPTDETEDDNAGEYIRPLVLARSINTRSGSPVKKDKKATPKLKIVTKKRGKTSYSTDCTYYDEAELTDQGSFTSEVWNLGPLHEKGIDGSGTTIAIIDSGINYAHPAFKNRIVAVKNFVRDEADNVDCVIDSDGHGTLCAGIAAGSSFYCPTSSSPKSECLKVPPGVAPGSKLVVCKVVKTCNGDVDSDALLRALLWLKKMHLKDKFKVDVISISLSSDYYHHPRAQVISELSAMGVVIVCCASNVGRLRLRPISFPGRLGHVLCVGAQDANGKPTSFSPVGRELDFLSPGDDIWGPGCGTEGPFAMNCASGTSCATPGLAGLVCLVLNAVAMVCRRNPKKYVIAGKSLLELVHNVWIMRELLKEMSSSPGHHSDEIGHGTLHPSHLLARGDDEVMRVIDNLIEDE